MIRRKMSTESACLDISDKERLISYRTFSVAFSYPDNDFFDFFSDLNLKRKDIVSLYDKLFRVKEIWLYSVEYLARHEFQRSNYLADIMGFYKAFGLVAGNDRPDSIESECEFMFFLIYKKIYARYGEDIADREEKQVICEDAGKKFFFEYIYPSVGKIADKIINGSDKNFYTDKAGEFITFLEKEKNFFSAKPSSQAGERLERHPATEGSPERSEGSEGFSPSEGSKKR